MTGQPPLFSLFVEIGIIEQLARNRFERVLPDGLRVSHFGALNHMVRLGDGDRLVDLARAFQVTKATMTNTIQKLEERGLVRVGLDPEDGRAKRVFLTDAGRRSHEACIAAVMPEIERMAGDLGHDTVDKALPHLETIRRYLDQNRPD